MSNNQFKKVLVTGGAGFIGSHLVDTLLDRGIAVTVIDNLINGSLENLKTAQATGRLTFIEGDILNFETCVSTTTDIDAVFHLACLGVRHSLHDPRQNNLVNSQGTINVLEGARRNQVKKVIYVSTSEIYGRVNTFPISETVIPHPLTVYGASKLAGELSCLAYKESYNLDIDVIRIFNNFGPRAHYEGDAGELIPRTIISLLKKESPVIFGDGSATRDFVFVQDTAQALVHLLNCGQGIAAPMNFGSGIERSVTSVVTTLGRLMSIENMRIEHIGNRPADVPRLRCDAHQFTTRTNYQLQTSFDDGLRQTIAYYTEIFRKNSNIFFPLKNWEKK